MRKLLKNIKFFFAAIKEFIQAVNPTLVYVLEKLILRVRFNDELRRLVAYRPGTTGRIFLYYSADEKTGYTQRISTEAILAFEKELNRLGYQTVTGAGADYLEFREQLVGVRR